MKIMIVHEDRRPPGEGGGAESIVRDHAKAMKAFGHTVSWWWGDGNIEQAVAAYKPDMLHVMTIHNYIDGWLDMMRWVQAQRIPHVWVLMDYWPFCRGRTLLRQTTDGETCTAKDDKCDGECLHGRSEAEWAKVVNGSPIVSMNQYSADIYRRNGVPCDYVVEMGVDTEMFAPDQSKGLSGSVYTSSAWADVPVKGMQIVSQAVRGTQVEVNLITKLPREKVAEALKRADIYVFPSIYEETFGLCLCEAMASGCAVIASDVAGARAQVHPELGVLVPPRDPQALREALDYLIARPELVRLMGEAARAHVMEDHSLEAMGRRWEAVYQAVLGRVAVTA